MGRKRTNQHNLPPRMSMKKNGWYYHVSSTVPRKWTPLGNDLNAARRKWAELEEDPIQVEDKTFNIVGQRYMREILPTLKPNTQRDYTQYFNLLNAVFDAIPIDRTEEIDRKNAEAKMSAPILTYVHTASNAVTYKNSVPLQPA